MHEDGMRRPLQVVSYLPTIRKAFRTMSKRIYQRTYLGVLVGTVARQLVNPLGKLQYGFLGLRQQTTKRLSYGFNAIDPDGDHAVRTGITSDLAMMSLPDTARHFSL